MNVLSREANDDDGRAALRRTRARQSRQGPFDRYRAGRGRVGSEGATCSDGDYTQ